MQLSTYLLRTQRLLQNPPAPSTLYSPTDLTDYINQARGQVAGEGECVRVLASLITTVGQRNYNFTALNTGTGNGVQGVVHVRRIAYAVGVGGQRWIPPRAWEWFDLFHLNNPVPPSGAPKVWAQYAQGIAGSFYLDPIPDIRYTLSADTVCYPIDLSSDTDVDAIPYFWTDAVPYYAAYLALLSAQSPARQADGNRMFERYTEFVTRARRFANPSVNRGSYEQTGSPTDQNKLNIQPARGQQGAA